MIFNFTIMQQYIIANNPRFIYFWEEEIEKDRSVILAITWK